VDNTESAENPELAQLYAQRFDATERAAKARLWSVLVSDFLQKYVSPDATILDVAGGLGEFADHVRAARKILVDLAPAAGTSAEVRIGDARRLAEHTDLANAIDVAFVSNFFEHLASKDDLLTVLRGIRSLLKPTGSLLVIQPNFRYSFREYYDFIDHTLPLTDRSLTEALQLAGFSVDEMIPRFLPFTTKGRASSPLLLRIYLRLPFAWRIFGQQMFVRAVIPRLGG
jgi:SAM-dependent methyltransferase